MVWSILFSAEKLSTVSIVQISIEFVSGFLLFTRVPLTIISFSLDFYPFPSHSLHPSFLSPSSSRSLSLSLLSFSPISFHSPSFSDFIILFCLSASLTRLPLLLSPPHRVFLSHLYIFIPLFSPFSRSFFLLYFPCPSHAWFISFSSLLSSSSNLFSLCLLKLAYSSLLISFILLVFLSPLSNSHYIQ